MNAKNKIAVNKRFKVNYSAAKLRKISTSHQHTGYAGSQASYKIEALFKKAYPKRIINNQTTKALLVVVCLPEPLLLIRKQGRSLVFSGAAMVSKMSYLDDYNDPAGFWVIITKCWYKVG